MKFFILLSISSIAGCLWDPVLGIVVGPKCYKCLDCANGESGVEYCQPGDVCGAYMSAVYNEDGTGGVALLKGCIRRKWRFENMPCENNIRLLAAQEGGPNNPFIQRLNANDRDSTCCMACFEDLCNNGPPQC